MKDDFREYRYVENIHQDGNSRKLVGKAISFNTVSNYLYELDMFFYETIHREAITQELLDNSNVIFLFNHNNDLILGRSNHGKGSLSLELREDGVYFSLELPNTSLGNDIYELVLREDISQCSFCFTIPEGGDKWTMGSDGKWYRDIYEINGLYDISCVNTPAYNDTSIYARSIELFEMKNKRDNMKREDIKEEEKEEPKDEEMLKDVNSENSEEPKEESKEEPVPEEKKEEEETREDSTKEEEEKEEPEEDKEESREEEKEDKEVEEEEEVEELTKEEDEKRSNINIMNKTEKHNNTMNKRFSLTKAILDVAEGRGLDRESRMVQDEIKKSMRNANISMNGQIQLPFETRDLSVAGEGEDIVETKIQSVLEPLREKNILVQLGAKWISGLTSDIQVPIMGKTNVGFKGETASADNGANTFSNVKFTPHRLTAYVPISKQLLIQSTPDVETLIYNDLVEAINGAIEAEAFSSNTRDANDNPGGIFAVSGVVSGSAINSFTDITNNEALLEDANVDLAKCKYALSPSMKAQLRQMIKGTNNTGMILEQNEVDGTAALCSGHLNGKTLVYGDWSQYCVAQFGNVDITVDPYTLAADGQIKLVVNVYVDFRPLRPEVFLKAVNE